MVRQFLRQKIDDDTKRLWGMNRSLVNNAVIGSHEGFEKILEFVGVGYGHFKGKYSEFVAWL